LFVFIEPNRAFEIDLVAVDVCCERRLEIQRGRTIDVPLETALRSDAAIGASSERVMRRRSLRPSTSPASTKRNRR